MSDSPAALEQAREVEEACARLVRLEESSIFDWAPRVLRADVSLVLAEMSRLSRENAEAVKECGELSEQMQREYAIEAELEARVAALVGLLREVRAHLTAHRFDAGTPTVVGWINKALVGEQAAEDALSAGVSSSEPTKEAR
ncbi:MAG TPA: hypothetical protein VFG23_19195 [Polyangia bacterium]|nr:hypothetical protein [Polyangia bacterium]